MGLQVKNISFIYIYIYIYIIINDYWGGQRHTIDSAGTEKTCSYSALFPVLVKKKFISRENHGSWFFKCSNEWKKPPLQVAYLIMQTSFVWNYHDEFAESADGILWDHRNLSYIVGFWVFESIRQLQSICNWIVPHKTTMNFYFVEARLRWIIINYSCFALQVNLRHADYD